MTKVVASETHFQRVVNLSKVLMVIVFVLTGLVAHQYVNTRELQRVDCAATEERIARSMLYDNLIAVWASEPGLSQASRDALVQAYGKQRVQVEAAAAAAAKACS